MQERFCFFLLFFLVPCTPNLSLHRKVRGWLLPKFYNTENKVIYSSNKDTKVQVRELNKLDM